jgi:hypothetical protein
MRKMMVVICPTAQADDLRQIIATGKGANC